MHRMVTTKQGVKKIECTPEEEESIRKKWAVDKEDKRIKDEARKARDLSFNRGLEKLISSLPEDEQAAMRDELKRGKQWEA